MSGGHAALDFVNTVTQLRSQQKQKRKHWLACSDLIRWAKQMVSSADADGIACRAEDVPPGRRQEFCGRRLNFANPCGTFFLRSLLITSRPVTICEDRAWRFPGRTATLRLKWTGGAVGDWKEPDSLEKMLRPVLHAGVGLLACGKGIVSGNARRATAPGSSWITTGIRASAGAT
jgi:hypothetical protein